MIFAVKIRVVTVTSSTENITLAMAASHPLYDFRCTSPIFALTPAKSGRNHTLEQKPGYGGVARVREVGFFWGNKPVRDCA
jgi:hypothetical protein